MQLTDPRNKLNIAAALRHMTVRSQMLLSICVLVVVLVTGVVVATLKMEYALQADFADREAALARELARRQQAVVDGVAARQLTEAEAALTAKAKALAEVLATLAPVSLLTLDTEPLDNYCSQICRDSDVVLCYVADGDDAIRTTYRNTGDASLARLLGLEPAVAAQRLQQMSVAAIARALQQTEKVLEARAPVVQDNQQVGSVVLLTSREKVLGQMVRSRREFRKLQQDLRDFWATLNRRRESHGQQQAQNSIIVGGIATLVAVLLGALAAWSISASFSRPLSEAVSVLEAVARGDLSKRLENQASNELGRMATALNTAIQSQAEAVEQLEESACREHEQSALLRAEVDRRQKAQAEIAKARDAAEAASRAKSQFLANMSHEIRTPLNAILGYANVLLNDRYELSAAEREDYLRTVYTSGRHLLSLIEDVLDLSKIEAGALKIEKRSCSPHDILADVISVVRVRSQEKGLYLRCEWPGGFPARIHTDPDRLRQILVNLIGNAVKFTRVGGVRIVTQIERRETGSEMVVQIVDTGIGIPQHKLEAIFDPFVQADNSVTREFGGTGLGLAICQRIAAALGGSLEVSSRLDRGSTFTLRVPTGPLDGVEIIQAPLADGVSGPATIVDPTQVDLTGTRVLLAEDGETNRKLVSLLLQRAGATVLTAENGQVALEIVQSQPFDLVLMDMQMPILDGYSATTMMRQRGFDLPIVALTAHAMQGDEQKCRDAGCSGYLSKPVDPGRLMRTVVAMLPTESARTPLPTDDAVQIERPTADPPGEAVDPTALPSAAVHVSSNPSPQLEPLESTLPMDDPEFREIAEEFAQRLGEKTAAMEQALEAADFARLALLAHWLKGSGGTAGFGAFTQPALGLEQAAKRGQADECRRMVERIVALGKRLDLTLASPLTNQTQP